MNSFVTICNILRFYMHKQDHQVTQIFTLNASHASPPVFSLLLPAWMEDVLERDVIDSNPDSIHVLTSYHTVSLILFLPICTKTKITFFRPHFVFKQVKISTILPPVRLSTSRHLIRHLVFWRYDMHTRLVSGSRSTACINDQQCIPLDRPTQGL